MQPALCAGVTVEKRKKFYKFVQVTDGDHKDEPAGDNGARLNQAVLGALLHIASQPFAKLTGVNLIKLFVLGPVL